MVTTGECAYLKKLFEKVPRGLLEIMRMEGVGSSKARYVWKKFGVFSVSHLKRLCVSGKLSKERGWGEKSVQNILRAIELSEKFGERLPIGSVQATVEAILKGLKKTKLAEQVEIAGSFRRGKETVGDLDFVASSKKPKELIDAFARLPEVEEVKVKGATKCTVFLKSGIDADLRVVKQDEFGAALYYSTGSQAHNVAVRQRALKMGLTVNEYGVFKGTKTHKEKCVASATEQDVFQALNLPFIPPELRENTGELENFPKDLIELKDVRGDLHLHTNFSDGFNTAVEMITAAKKKGFEYIAITDHASIAGFLRGLKKENYLGYIKSIRAAAKKVGGIEVLVGTEVDIMADGSLFLPDSVLKKLDWVVASLHSHFKQSKEEVTARAVRALGNPYVTVFGHPTARHLGKREPVEFDFEKIIAAAKKNRVLLEINASAGRLDLNDVHCRAAGEAGALFVMSSDSHHHGELDLSLGVAQARRGWIRKNQVVNTKPLIEFKKWLKARKK